MSRMHRATGVVDQHCATCGEVTHFRTYESWRAPIRLAPSVMRREIRLTAVCSTCAFRVVHEPDLIARADHPAQHGDHHRAE